LIWTITFDQGATAQGHVWEWVGKSFCLTRGNKEISGISAGAYENSKEFVLALVKTI
jgi:hypothetical protein